MIKNYYYYINNYVFFLYIIIIIKFHNIGYKLIFNFLVRKCNKKKKIK